MNKGKYIEYANQTFKGEALNIVINNINKLSCVIS